MDLKRICQVCGRKSLTRQHRDYYGATVCRVCKDHFELIVQNNLQSEMSCENANSCDTKSNMACMQCRHLACLKAGMSPIKVPKDNRLQLDKEPAEKMIKCENIETIVINSSDSEECDSESWETVSERTIGSVDSEAETECDEETTEIQQNIEMQSKTAKTQRDLRKQARELLKQGQEYTDPQKAERESVRRGKCPKCELEFSYNESLRNHMRDVHGYTLKSGPHVCCNVRYFATSCRNLRAES